MKNRIGFAGDGWGALSAVKSLKKMFTLEFLTNDKNIVAELTNNHYQVNNFNEFKSKIIICAGYTSIIPQKILEKHNLVNIHYSLLPKYRGLHSTAWAIMNGETELGLSIHEMNEYIDDGDIIHQKSFINDDKSSATHYMELMNEYIDKHLGSIINYYIQGKIIPVKQDKSKASWVGKRSLKHNILDFAQGNEVIKRLLRVLTPPYPAPYVIYKNDIYNVGNITFHNSNIQTDISRILNIDNEGIWVKSKDGYIIIKNIFLEDNHLIQYSNFKIGEYFND